MNIVIVGGGFTGAQLARDLVDEKNKVSVVESDQEIADDIANRIDCTVVCAEGNNLEALEEAGIEKADALVCVTPSDEVNMITCSLVDAVYPDVLKIARVRNYAYYVNTASAEKKHANEFGSGNHRPLYGINFMVHPDVEAAEAIIRSVENGAVGNVITFDESGLELVRVNVEKESKLCGTTLKTIRNLTDVNFLVAYVESDGITSLPSGNTEITEGCTLGILLDKADIAKVMELCGSSEVGEISTYDSVKHEKTVIKNQRHFFKKKKAP